MLGIIISVIGGIVSIISMFLTMIEKAKARKSAAEAAEHAKNADAANRSAKELYDKILARIGREEAFEDSKEKVRTFVIGKDRGDYIELGEIQSAFPNVAESDLRKIILELLSEGIIREFNANGARDIYVVVCNTVT